MIPIALQLYSVRDDAAADLAGTLRQVAEMGYDGVEFAGFHNHDPREVRKMLDDAGLRCSGSHTKWPLLMDDDELARTIEAHRAVGCDALILPSMPEEKRKTADACRATGEALTALTEKLAAENMRTGYHCHYHDVLPIDGDKSAWDLLGQHTPDSFILQYDTANGMQGGADPVAPIRQFPGRGELMHLKEYASGHGKAVIGEGDVPWTDVFDACETIAGTRWYVVEQEGHATLSPMEAARRCIENLREMGK